ncbi:carbohydrate kinase [Natronococcus jeotgali DSM 18795]|uniref:Bifunctional NAD(P)H-hydrate repair enzyme n=2 Tax=Natronococcus jeotgali TaxID=413812 RepID=L9WUI2_9EURY|nr:carbohydrate kinase [Natronococcus jeotgali DSM 18795]
MISGGEPGVLVEPEDVHGRGWDAIRLSVSSAIFNGAPRERTAMITGERMAAVDENAAALGVSQKQLMESSGNAVARAVREVADRGSSVAVVAGRGNNGGDAFVAARFLESYDVTTLLLGPAENIGTEIARENWEALQHAGYDTHEIADSSGFELPDCDVVVDAMLGTGISGELREPAATAAEAINAADATVVAVDVPSGFDADAGAVADNAVEADRVVTFHDAKPGLAELDCELAVADIGIPAAAERDVGPGDVSLAEPDGREGRAYVIGGGPYTGAPALAAQAALRTGAELSFVAAPDAVAGEIQGYAEDLIVQPYESEILTPEVAEDLLETATSYDNVVVIGPGLGTDEETLEAARRFLSGYDGRAVVDADALEVVPEVETDATLVCTPNRGELARMGGPDADDLAAVADEIEDFAAELGHVVLAKGENDVISDGERTRISRSGTVGMKVGGTGDTLAGIVAALLEGAEPVDAAAAGAHVNGLAGERLAECHEHGFLASELLEELPPTLWGGDDE